jgi:hypothetical protein
MALQTRNATTAVNYVQSGYAWGIVDPFPAGNYVHCQFNAASHPVPVSTDWIELGGFGFAIPSTAPLNSITVNFTMQVSPDAAAEGAIYTARVMPFPAGEQEYACPGTATPIAASMSGPGTLWGGAFTPAIINGASFKVHIKAQWFRVSAMLQNLYVIAIPSVTVDYVGSDAMMMSEA